ncbi:MAG: DUF2764 domain-containing protein [Treponema sp.]|nr:DUF2764 domain-containing protein [Treponema sp.]
MGYYYLMAQLPYLIYGQGVPMSSQAFKGLCEGALSPDDRALLKYCTLDPEPEGTLPQNGGEVLSYQEPPSPVSSEFLDSWRNWERTLRLNLARFRSLQLKREGAGASVDPPDYPADAAGVAKAALAMDSPLEAEFFLDKSRWDFIESLQGLDYFGRNTVYAYLLKLFLLERRSLFRAEEGFTEYKGLYAAIMEAAPNVEEKTDV